MVQIRHEWFLTLRSKIPFERRWKRSRVDDESLLFEEQKHWRWDCGHCQAAYSRVRHWLRARWKCGWHGTRILFAISSYSPLYISFLPSLTHSLSSCCLTSFRCTMTRLIKACSSSNCCTRKKTKVSCPWWPRSKDIYCSPSVLRYATHHRFLVGANSIVQLYMYQLQNMNDLVGVAFFDAQIFITSCQTIKNYIMIGDMYKSIYFLRWKVRTCTSHWPSRLWLTSRRKTRER